MTFQMSFSGWVLRVSSQARTAISLAPSRSSTSTSSDQKHQHQNLPYLLGFSGWSSVHTCHVSPPSIVTSTRVTFFPPPVVNFTPGKTKHVNVGDYFHFHDSSHNGKTQLALSSTQVFNQTTLPFYIFPDVFDFSSIKLKINFSLCR